ncbi:unnamed protein product [Ceutorhynchus assimilis]|uniref:Sodium/nucleoside cotransporter n=1 Tax=Ceutorhynchus assimilis TaxID=467358 RepID=A0A9N9MSQ3_9CUCU|nr:unnamed protein product [Ceutorhynchus assimilis]
MESNYNSTQSIIKDHSNLNHSIDLSNGPSESPDANHRKKRKYAGSLNKHVIYFMIFALITAHVIWATVHFFRQNNYNVSWETFRETTDKGYGLMVILYIIYVYSLAYYYVFKPFAGEPLKRYVWNPAIELSHSIRYGSYMFYIFIFAITLAYLIYDAQDDYKRLIPLGGLVVFLLAGFAFSTAHRLVPWRTIAWGIILQFAFGFLTIRWEVGRNVLITFSNHVNTFLDYGVEAAAFTYGDFLVNQAQVFAFRALSVVFFINFVVNLLYYYGLMQKFVNMLGGALQYIMGTTICESVNSVAVAFVGMSEGPMMLRPYLKHLTDSELHSMLLAGFASVSGSTFAAYISYGARAQDLITASIMSSPSALCFSKLLYPETEEVKIKKKDVRMVEVEHSSAIDAASKGALDAFHLIAAIISGVTATLAFVYFLNGVLTWLGMLVGFTEDTNKWTLELIAGKIFIPVAYIMGIEWEECEKVGQVIGVKTMVNEFVAFSRLGDMNLSARSKVIATYAICGFSNPGSMGIMVSTMATLVPEKKENVTRIIFRALVGGALVCFMTACIAGVLMPDSALDMDSVTTDNSTINY